MQNHIARALVLLSLSLASCQSAYYATMDTLGVHKREILVDRVEAGREEQAEAQEQFQTTLEAFQGLTGFEGGELATQYETLNREYEDAADRAQDVNDRIESIESVATALFDEWTTEAESISNPNTRQQSLDMLDDTKARYGVLVAKMRVAADRMDPVLTAFRDQVLFLKHNLNARAIDSLESTALEIEDDVQALIAEMQAAIDEADSFIAEMSQAQS